MASIPKTITTFVSIPLAAALGLTGCESLGTDPIRKYELPANLAIDKGQRESTATVTEPLAAQPSRPPEIYRGTGSLVGRSGSPAETRPRKEGKYTLNFDDADLAEVAKVIFGEILKVNYTMDPKVSGKVTLQTTHPLAEDEILPTVEMLLKMNGAVLIKSQGVYRIEPDASALVDAPGAALGGTGLGSGYQLRVVPLRYVSVQEMQKVLEPLMPPKSIVKIDTVRNMMLLAGTPEELESVLETIRIFDVDFMSGMSVGIFPLKNVEPGLVAEELNKVLGDTGKGPLAGLVRILPIDRLNSILAVTPQPRYLDEIEAWIERLDRYTTHRAGGIHVYRVQNVDAVELANTLSNIFGGGTGSGRRPSLSPGLQGGSIGTPYGASGGFGSSGSTFGGSGGGSLGGGSDFGTGSSFGSSNSGGTGLGASGSSLGGMGSSGTSSTGSFGGTSTSGSSSGFGTSGGFGGGIGRGGSAGRTRGSVAADLGNARIVADPTNNALIITARAQDYNEIETVIKELDVVPRQVLIDASIVEISLTGQLQYGVQWLFGHLRDRGDDRGAAALGSTGSLTDDAVTTAAAAASGGFTYAFINNAKDIRILMNALAKDNKINVISSPSLMVLNNQEAQINVGDKVPQPTYTAANVNTGTTTPFVTSSLTLVESGVTLRVRPRVNSGGLVTMDLIQEVSTPTLTTVANTQAYQFAQRKIQSSVAVNNADTLVLGGLINDRVTRDQSGIPFLYQLPLLGPLFGTTNNQSNRTELVVLITPRVVENRGKARDITNEFRRKLTGLYQSPPSRPEETSRNPTP